ncbi:type II toxin-antitoxin system RatA family toxin [Candidatus Symbiobacter mobilis]|uniref:Lipid transport protein n=1 Tax=Candidatus Symbiobacter mobilis CR TaxID=946483 RepID=U5NEP4_9BURK|nr:type II toxin-antitoxin system RatA family toxin [Candidatus Symbiobacter mobilis]AGX88629.1 lipid transport protein [Candidatus Symbiobacter mobilis CR]
MKTVHKSVLIWYSPAEMYRLVTDVDSYPRFLPWCDHARVVTQEPEGMTAEIGISFAGLRQSFVTRNRHVEDRQVAMHLVRGPFSRLEGHWNFHPVGDGQRRACKVELVLTYGFERTFGLLIGPMFDKVAATMVDAFVRRAREVYGE